MITRDSRDGLMAWSLLSPRAEAKAEGAWPVQQRLGAIATPWGGIAMVDGAELDGGQGRLGGAETSPDPGRPSRVEMPPGPYTAHCDGDLGAQLARIDERLAALLTLFHDRIHDDLVKGQLFERLHHDLSRYRDDFIYNHVTKRIFTDLIGLFDRVDGLIREPLSDGISREDLVAHLRSFRSEILQSLRRQEVSLTETPPAFDETWQEAIEARSVDRVEDDQKVLGVLRRGFAYRGRVLRPEGVAVGRYARPREEPSDG